MSIAASDPLIDWPGLQQGSRTIRQAVVTPWQHVLELCIAPGGQMLRARTVRLYQQLLKGANGFWTLLAFEGSSPTTPLLSAAPVGDAAEDPSSRPILQAVICRGLLLSVTTTLSQ